MKIKVLSLLVPALLVAGTAHAAEIYNKDGNKLDLYGQLKAQRYFSKNKTEDGDKSYLRGGFKGETQVNDQVTGYGQWEYELHFDTPEAEGNKGWTRLGFAGVRVGDVGSFDYGRNFGVMYDIGAWTDVLPEFGGDSYTDQDNFMFGRGNSMATYRNSDFFGLVKGLNFALQYQGSNGNHKEGTKRQVLTQNGDSYGASVTYDMSEYVPGLSIGTAMMSAKRTAQQNGDGFEVIGHGKRAEAYTAGIKYSANDIYLAAMFTESRNAARFGEIGTEVVDNETVNKYGGYAHKAQSFEAVAQYTFDFGLQPTLAYVQTKGKDIEGVGSEYLVKYTTVGANYFFNKNISTYVNYKINMLKENKFAKDAGLNTKNEVALGILYQF